jgi:hypothetical protein
VHTYIFENELFPTDSVQQRQHVGVVGCRKFFSVPINFRKFLLDSLHLLAPPWLGACPKVEKERILKPIMGSSTNFVYGQLVCYIAVLGFSFWSYKKRTNPGGRSLDGIAGSHPVGGRNVCLLWILSVVK